MSARAPSHLKLSVGTPKGSEVAYTDLVDIHRSEESVRLISCGFFSGLRYIPAADDFPGFDEIHTVA